MFAVIVFIALLLNVLGQITGGNDRWGEWYLLVEEHDGSSKPLLLNNTQTSFLLYSLNRGFVSC